MEFLSKGNSLSRKAPRNEGKRQVVENRMNGATNGESTSPAGGKSEHITSQQRFGSAEFARKVPLLGGPFVGESSCFKSLAANFGV